MSEQNLSMDDLFGNGVLDLGGNATDYDPFAQMSQEDDEPSGPNIIPFFDADESDASEDTEDVDTRDNNDDEDVQPESNTSVIPMQAPAKPSNVATPDFNPLAAAVGKAEDQNVKVGAANVLSKPPIFFYGSAKEDIVDKILTFEQLRIAKSEDFPELEEGMRVTWTMEYGTITKTVPKPKETVIQKLKEEIETSKEFLEMLKKQKDKKDELLCKAKPRIIAQSKGVLSPYKGVFTSMEEAQASDKAIQIVPGRDGKVYEIRCTEAGRFIAPTTNVPELSEVGAGFFPALPRIPFTVICQVIGFFRYFMGERELEAMVQIYWDKLEGQYRIVVPKQYVGKAHVDAQLDSDDALDDDRYFCVADIHSHNSMSAKFSATDDRDEQMTRVYMVIGELNHFFPRIAARISCGGKAYPIDPDTVIEGLSREFPQEWTEQVETELNQATHWLKGANHDEILP